MEVAAPPSPQAALADVQAAEAAEPLQARPEAPTLEVQVVVVAQAIQAPPEVVVIMAVREEAEASTGLAQAEAALAGILLQ